jgi:hypothetical protein
VSWPGPATMVSRPVTPAAVSAPSPAFNESLPASPLLEPAVARASRCRCQRHPGWCRSRRSVDRVLTGRSMMVSAPAVRR